MHVDEQAQIAAIMDAALNTKPGKLQLIDADPSITRDIRGIESVLNLPPEALLVKHCLNQGDTNGGEPIRIHAPQSPEHDFDVPVMTISGTFASAWANSRGRSRFIISAAHEVGHMLAGHLRTTPQPNPAIELEADEHAGRIARLLGFDERHIEDWVSSLTHPEGCATHPPHAERLAAALKGFRSAEECGVDIGSWNRPPADNGYPAVGRPQKKG